MKRLMIVSMLALTLLVMTTVASQAAGNVGFGGKGGVNFSTFNGDDSEGAETRVGFAFGAYLDFPLSPSISFHPEALYFMKGAEATEGGLTLTFKLDYIEVPLLLVFRIPNETSKITPMFYAGPSFGLNLSSKVKGEAGGNSAEADIDNAKSLDIGIAFGGGAEIGVGDSGNKLHFDLRYTLGLTEAFDDVTPPPGDNDVANDDGSAPALKNGTISIMLGFGI